MAGGGRGALWDRVLLGPQRRRRRMLRTLRRLDAGHVAPAVRRRTEGGHTVLVATVTTVVFCIVATTTLPGLLPESFRLHVGLPVHPSAVFSGDGTYAFIRVQPGSKTQPVAYDRCHQIHVVLNPDGGPHDASALVQSAMGKVSRASGLTLVYDGLTSRRPSWTSSRISPVPGPAPPVLVAFANAEEVPRLKGKVAGLGGSTAISAGFGRLQRYVTGQITLDSDSFDRLDSRFRGEAFERAIIMHEFGHVLGLAHVDDSGELMNRHNVGRTDFGPGDLEGLAILGQGRCF